MNNVYKIETLQKLRESAESIIENCTELSAIFGKDSIRVGDIYDIQECANEINSAYIAIIEAGRLQNVGFFDKYRNCQYHRIFDLVRFLRAWLDSVKQLQVGVWDSLVKYQMLEFAKAQSEAVRNEASSLFYFCRDEIARLGMIEAKKAEVCDDNSSETL